VFWRTSVLHVSRFTVIRQSFHRKDPESRNPVSDQSPRSELVEELKNLVRNRETSLNAAEMLITSLCEKMKEVETKLEKGIEAYKQLEKEKEEEIEKCQQLEKENEETKRARIQVHTEVERVKTAEAKLTQDLQAESEERMWLSYKISSLESKANFYRNELCKRMRKQRVSSAQALKQLKRGAFWKMFLTVMDKRPEILLALIQIQLLNPQTDLSRISSTALVELSEAVSPRFDSGDIEDSSEFDDSIEDLEKKPNSSLAPSPTKDNSSISEATEPAPSTSHQQNEPPTKNESTCDSSQPSSTPSRRRRQWPTTC